MADRYQGRLYPGGNDYRQDDGSLGSEKAEGDPLAELARLIGQTDPFGTGSMQRANLPLQPHGRPPSHPAYQDDEELPSQAEEELLPGPPSWMQRAVRQEPPPPPPEPDYPNSVHPLHRYAATHSPAQSDYHPNYDPEPAYVDVDAGGQPDLSRYDDALYGSHDRDAQVYQHDQDYQHDQGYVDDGYAYDAEPNEEREPKRRGGMITVAAVLALAVFGVGGAFAYRTYSSSVRSGEPPIIRADAGPTKIVPSPPDGATKVPDRMTTGDGMEKIVSREETPLDPNARSAPRVVWPTPQAANPATASVGPAQVSPTSGTMPNSEPHRIKTFPVRGEQADAGVPLAASPQPPAAAKPAPRAATAPVQRTASAANASASAPLSLSPQSNPVPPAPAVTTETQTRVAATNPAQIAPATPSAGAGGGYLVSVTSQPSEADAQASYRALQNKYPSMLGSQSPVVARANAKSGAVTYRAGVSFGTPAEAAQFCHNYQAAGGQCWVVKN